MKRTKAALLSLMLVMTMAGCASQGGNTEPAQTEAQTSSEGAQDKSEKADKAQKEDDTPKKELGHTENDTGIAQINITTVNQAADVMKFIDEPVARHVAEAISTWTPGYVIPPEPYYEACTVTVVGKDGTVYTEDAEADVKVRGNWTTNYPKKPLRIKFGEKQPMLGLNDGAEMKNWLLLAEYKDGSMLRDKAALDFSEDILGADGLYSADSELAEVTVNGEYRGVYLVSEQQQIASHRVDITECEKDYQGTDIGYFLEFDGYFYNEDDLQNFHVSYADNAALTPYDGKGGSSRKMKCLPANSFDERNDVGFSIKNDIYSQAQHDFIANYVENVYKIMYYAAYNDEAWAFDADYKEISKTTEMSPQDAVEAVVDVNSLADMYIISEMTCDADIYWSSFFMDADFGPEGNKKLTFEAPWDFDSAMGTKDRCANGKGFYAANIVPDVDGFYETINPWLAVLMYEDWYTDIIREKWTAAYDAGVFSDTIAMVHNDKTEYADAFGRNYDKWNNIVNNEQFLAELSKRAAECKTHGEAADYLEEWLTARVEFMNENWHE
ncbi:MAG: CotH kinase family protein [Ruminococcus sp.]|nr:CotH kinase family protein [Ruminococcus sp.]